MTQEALKLALEFVESINLGSRGASVEQQRQVITAIEKALAQPERDYERGFIDGMQKQMQSSVDKAVNRMAQTQEPVACAECERLKNALKRANGLAEHFERSWYLRGDEIERLKEQTQEPVAWMDADGNVSDNSDHNCFPIPLYTTPLQRTEQNFCSRCGKRTADLTVIHTCTPPQENT